jgi:hypothetical protein
MALFITYYLLFTITIYYLLFTITIYYLLFTIKWHNYYYYLLFIIYYKMAQLTTENEYVCSQKFKEISWGWSWWRNFGVNLLFCKLERFNAIEKIVYNNGMDILSLLCALSQCFRVQFLSFVYFLVGWPQTYIGLCGWPASVVSFPPPPPPGCHHFGQLACPLNDVIFWFRQSN